MSIAAAVERSLTATSGAVVTRVSSLNQRICSCVPSGTKRAAKKRRNAGLSRPQKLGMVRVSISASSRSCGVRARAMRPCT